MGTAGGRGSGESRASASQDEAPVSSATRRDERAARGRAHLVALCAGDCREIEDEWLEGILAIPYGRVRFADRPVDEVRANVRACLHAFRAAMAGDGEPIGAFASRLASQRFATGFDISAPVLAASEFRGAVSRVVRRHGLGATGDEIEAVELEARLAADALLLEFERLFTEAFMRCSLEAAEDRYRQRVLLVEKLLSVGEVAAGVAHELNNPLAWVTTNVEHVRAGLDRWAASGPPPAGEIESAARAAREAQAGLERLRDIVTDLNVYSRSADRAAEPVELPDVIDLALRMTRPVLRSVARVERSFSAMPPFFGFPGKLSQVFVNLFVNAAQAMEATDPKTNALRVEAHEAAGVFVVRVEDTGSGMPEDVAARIFEPFFTTKDEGLRSGLGLWISRSIVEEHRGTIDVESAPGRGTTFTLRMRGVAEAPRPAKSERPLAPARRRATVLFVDDEPMLLSAFVRALGDTHEVLVAGSASAALDIVRAREGRVDVVVCDLLMPDGGGIDLYETIRRELEPLASRVVFMSGGALTARARQILAEAPSRSLTKPFSLDELEETINNVIADNEPLT